MFSRYQEVNKIVNMTVLDLSIFDKRKLIYCTTLYCEEIQEHVLGKNVPKKCLYCSSNNKCCRVLNLFQFLFEGVIKTFIINNVIIV